jgi:hypothetical protein
MCEHIPHQNAKWLGTIAIVGFEEGGEHGCSTKPTVLNLACKTTQRIVSETLRNEALVAAR